MILISHRGNLNGPNSEMENHPDYINSALEKVSSVEIDVWYKENSFWLGHDEPTYEVKRDFFYNNSLWCHAKNIEALRQLSVLGVHFFWHQKDDVALTSRGYFWTYPGKQITTKSIVVMPEVEKPKENISIAAGICSDYIMEWSR